MLKFTKRPLSILEELLASEAAGGLILIATAVVALVVANTAAADIYFAGLHAYAGPLSIQHWINDGLMAVFFLLIGLEVKRELVEGELRSWSSRILPGAAAVGGVVVPALVFLTFNGADPALSRGWAIPAATDIAFALGVLSLLGSRVPVSLKIFLATLAIIDDLGAVILIALFYTTGVSMGDLAIAAGCVATLVLFNRLGIAALLAYLAVGAVLWVFLLRSGVHATLAGVITAFAIPLSQRSTSTLGPLHRLEHALHRPVAFVILPVFSFANAGVSLGGVSLEGLVEPLTLGTASALLVGKFVGVLGGVGLVVLGRFAQLPRQASWGHMIGVALLCGIGFTMSLFIGLLAFEDPALQDRAKIGILLGSLLAGLSGYLVLRSLHPTSRDEARQP